MKTTIQIPDETWKKLNIEAAERHQKGFSSIIAEAVENYLKRKGRARHLALNRKRRQIAQELFASISKVEGAEALETLSERRNQWRVHS